jgi:hypothetical protein
MPPHGGLAPTIFTTPTYRTASTAIPCSRAQSGSNAWQARAETLCGEACTRYPTFAAARHEPGEPKVHMRQVNGYSWGTDGAALGALHPKVELEIRCGRSQQRLCAVRSPAFLIGAAYDCDLVLGDPRFAEVHSYLFVSPARVTVRHLGFGPGLSVAGQDVTWATLQHNDELRTGPYEFRVRIEWPSSPTCAITAALLDPAKRIREFL